MEAEVVRKEEDLHQKN